MKTSTSRSSSVKHLTGNNDGKTLGTKNPGRARRRPRTSTGEKAALAHFTGRLFDLKREGDVQEEKSTKQKRPQAA
jgi:hypothetical protein